MVNENGNDLPDIDVQHRGNENLAHAFSGDRQTLEKLMAEIRRYVYSLALKFLKNEADAEDVTQEVLMIISQKGAQFRGDGGWKNWVWKVTRNACLMHIRYMSRRGGGRHTALEDHELEGRGLSPEAVVAYFEREAAFARALEQLPEETGQLVVLAIQGATEKEMEGVLGVLPGTAKIRLYRVRQKLRSSLTGFIE